MARLIKIYTNYGTLEAEYFVVPNSNGEDIIEGEYKEFDDDGEIICFLTSAISSNSICVCILCGIKIFISNH